MKKILFTLTIAALLASCSLKIDVTGTAITKHQGEKAVTTTFKTVSGGIFLKRGFQYNTYELGKSYSFRINSKLLYTEIR